MLHSAHIHMGAHMCAHTHTHTHTVCFCEKLLFFFLASLPPPPRCHFVLSCSGLKKRKIKYGLLYVESKIKKPEFIDTENRLMVARGRGGDGAKWVKVIKRYKFSEFPSQHRGNESN